MSLRIPRWLKWIGYPCFAGVAFLIFFYATFPYERVKRLIEGRLSVPKQTTIAIGKLGPKLFTGLTARDVVIRVFPKAQRHRPQRPPGPGRGRATPGMPGGPGMGRMAGGPMAGMPGRPGMPGMPGDPMAGMPGATAEGEPPAEPEPVKPERIVIDEVSVKVGLWRLIFGQGYEVDFYVAAFTGEIDGYWSFKPKSDAALRVEATGLDLGRLPMVATTLGVPAAGKFSGKVDLEMPRNWLPRASGKVEISCEGCSIGDGKGKLKIPGNAFLSQGLTIPKVELGEVGGRVAIKRGVARFENFAVRSDDVQLELSGSMRLSFPVGNSVLQSFLRFQIGRALKDRAKNVPFDLLEGSLARGKMSDGFYGLSLSGPLRRPRAVLSTVPPRS